mmetsp:Transcript_21341/g.52245  ORF Transcript_21341/g.52245 Transcript_21341/m.52245 type:complete len:489 (-) Transcript_21341:485-1951(-)
MRMLPLPLCACALTALLVQGAVGEREANTNTAYLVETVPFQTTMPTPDGVEFTGKTLVKLVNMTKETLDFTAMYWALTTEVQPPCKPDDDYCPDDAGFSRKQFDFFHAEFGEQLYEAIIAALKRGVKIRCIEAPGFGPSGNPESEALAKNFTNFEVRQIYMDDWYGDGIMHQKIWVFDGRHGYVGSANQDWKSLAQVKEIGIAFENAPDVVARIGEHFDVWWEFVDLDSQGSTVLANDTQYHVQRKVPCWSDLNPNPCYNPLEPSMPAPGDKQYNFQNPQPVALNGVDGDFYMSCSPPETCITGRTRDEDSLVDTILDAEKTVSISVMDWVPATIYSQVPIFWDALIDAVLKAVNSVPGMHVRLLVSKWAHTDEVLEPYLRALDAMGKACRASESNPCNGTLEIKLFQIPGWNSTERPDREFPGHTRVNHGKYIVTDRRANIGTSNMVWSYFHNTAGASFNLNHQPIVSKLQDVFDRDWSSQYAHPLE